MKKGLLLSIVASTVLFAGGDIAPVEPVAEAPAAACNDFYGHAGVGIIYSDPNTAVDNDATATYGVAAVLGVTKEIFSGLTVSAEVQGAAAQVYTLAATATRGPIMEAGALTQLSLGYSYCNTAVKVGRFAVPKSLSPLAYTGTDYFGLKKVTFEGALIANTDIPDTTVWAAYLHNSVTHATSDNAFDSDAATAGRQGHSTRARAKVVAAGLMNKSFADTTITLAGYYWIDSKDWAAAGSIDHKWCDTDLSAGAAYYYDKAAATGSYVVGGYVTQHFGPVDAQIAATFGDAKFAKYTDITNQATGTGTNSWAIGGSLSTKVSGFKLKVFGDYRKDKTYTAGVSVGKTVSGIALSTDVRYRHNGVADTNALRVRAKAVYKF